MSVALEFAPVVEIPAHARLRAAQRSVLRDECRALATVTALPQLPRPSSLAVASPLRLTRRGVVALGAAAAVLSVALIGAAWLSAPNSAGGSAHVSAPASAPATVTVRAGDSLWAIAERLAPNLDPRAEVAALQKINHVDDGSALIPGQVLRTR